MSLRLIPRNNRPVVHVATRLQCNTSVSGTVWQRSTFRGMPVRTDRCRLWHKLFIGASMTAGDVPTKFCKNRALPSNTFLNTHDLSFGMLVRPSVRPSLASEMLFTLSLVGYKL
jgi:hypothetical protein